MGGTIQTRSDRPYRPLLLLLCALFALRVVAQFALQFADVTWLPRFSAWDSGTLSYPLLLAAQLLILTLMLWGIRFVPASKPAPRFAQTLIALGGIYAAAMALRLIIGVSDALDHPWFDGAISTGFHFVLAAYLILFGSALGDDVASDARVTARAARWAGYPAGMALSIGLFAWLMATGGPTLFAAYLAIALGGLWVLLHESLFPFREDWRPTRRDVLSDGAFLVLVQMALPLALKASVAAAIIWLAGREDGLWPGVWPQEWPIAAQVALMLLMAEFFRYWIHRALHTITPLWRVHAVHHAAGKLYTVNVARFHPIDKALQFLGDAAPFLVLGVSADVFAAYFVVYAVNGFYQHSNADVRLGPLNWIVAGPELHRWHHSRTLREAQSNYGNNLIVWDAVFGTRYLPRDQAPGAIGIGNANWPTGFLDQFAAPFRFKTDAQ